VGDETAVGAAAAAAAGTAVVSVEAGVCRDEGNSFGVTMMTTAMSANARRVRLSIAGREGR
jgi:hypothetical protein